MTIEGEAFDSRCTYCLRPATTEDDVPPKSLFRRPRLSLVTVPSCLECNQGLSLDDEYFRTSIVLRRDVQDHPDASEIYENAMRGLKRRGASGLGGQIARTTRWVKQRTAGGIITPPQPAFSVDLTRLDRVAARTVEGLFRHHYGWALYPHYAVQAFSLSGLAGIDDLTRSRLLATLRSLTARPCCKIGGDAFNYWRDVDPKNPGASAWFLLFFRRVGFVVLSVPAPAVGQCPMKEP